MGIVKRSPEADRIIEMLKRKMRKVENKRKGVFVDAMGIVTVAPDGSIMPAITLTPIEITTPDEYDKYLETKDEYFRFYASLRDEATAFNYLSKHMPPEDARKLAKFFSEVARTLDLRASAPVYEGPNGAIYKLTGRDGGEIYIVKGLAKLDREILPPQALLHHIVTGGEIMLKRPFTLAIKYLPGVGIVLDTDIYDTSRDEDLIMF